MTWNLEPHVALEIFEEMLAETHVDIFFDVQLASVEMNADPQWYIESLTATNGDVFKGRVFIEGSYEGDLVAMANVTLTMGREAKAQYNESLAGRTAGAKSNQFDLAINPYDSTGALLPLIQPSDGVSTEGAADKKITAYNFRLCVTKNRSNLVPFAKPSAYNSSTWELLRRYIAACTAGSGTARKGCQLGYPSCNTQPVPKGKFDMNNCGGISSDFIGASWAYPMATPAARRAIWTQHRDYVQVRICFSKRIGLALQWRASGYLWLCNCKLMATTFF